MPEPKPVEQYEVTPISPNDGNGQKSGDPTIDERSRQTAMMKAAIENEIAQREQLCAAEIKGAIEALAKKHHCIIKFIESRDIAENRTVGISIQPVAMERLRPEQAA